MVITIEDIIETLHFNTARKTPETGKYNISSPADRSFLNGVSEYTVQGKTLSTNQVYVALKIINKHIPLMLETFSFPNEDAILEFCKHPQYRNEPYKSTKRPREIRFIGKRKIAFNSKKSSQVIDRIKAIKDPYGIIGVRSPYFVYDHLVWVVEITQTTLERVYTAIQKLNFGGNEELVEFFEKCEESKNKQSNTKITDECIQLEINNDEFFAGWFDQILEVDIDVRDSESPKESSDS